MGNHWVGVVSKTKLYVKLATSLFIIHLHFFLLKLLFLITSIFHYCSFPIGVSSAEEYRFQLYPPFKEVSFLYILFLRITILFPLR